MKKLSTLLFTFGLAAHALAQGFVQLGIPEQQDAGYRTLITAEGGIITAGSRGPNAVLYKTDCFGNVVASYEKPVPGGTAVFLDVIELPDGSLVAAGLKTQLADTSGLVFICKTNAMLEEVASNEFKVLSKDCNGYSLARTASGKLLVWGSVAATFPDFSDAYLQTVDANSLAPLGNPVIFSNGTDLAARIQPTPDGNFLLSGSSLSGNLLDPDVPIDQFLQVYKVNETGTTIWHASAKRNFPTIKGITMACGTAINPVTGNVILGGTTYQGSDDLDLDAFFALIDQNTGAVLDTAFLSAAGQQQMFGIAAATDNPGLFTAVGNTDGNQFGVPAIAFAQVYEVAGTLFPVGTYMDVNTALGLRDIAELDAGRYVLMGTVPDNFQDLSLNDILVLTPDVSVEVVYQNCALAASLSASGASYQWNYEGLPIAGATQGVYFPTQPGLYQVEVVDAKTCYGISDTFRVEAPLADFSSSSNGLECSFLNLSNGASSYIWHFGDGTSSTLANPVHVYSASDDYTVTLIAVDGCGLSDTISYNVGITPAAEPLPLSFFSLAPNPSNGEFRLMLEGPAQPELHFAVYNTMGQLMQQTTRSFETGRLNEQFHLEQLPAGVYWFRIDAGDYAKTTKIIIDKP